MRQQRVRSSDGTDLLMWRNGGQGPPVLMSNGLGAPPDTWPGITDEGSPFNVAGWFHRGTGGSKRPDDVERVSVEDHADDCLAVMDAAGFDRAVVVGWSLGVNVAFEFALRHPERVAGILAVAGVPGGTFGALFAPLRIPRRLRRPIGLVGTKVLARVGPLVRFVEGGLPPSEAFDTHVLPPLGRRLTHVQAGLRTVRQFARHDWPWYSHLVRAGERHAPLEINAITCPVTFVSGTFDVLASSADIRKVAKGLPASRLVELTGSHYLPLEYPDELKGELTRLTDRA